MNSKVIFQLFVFLFILYFYIGCCDANQLVVIIQPIDSVAGELLSVQPQVALVDYDGKTLRDVNFGEVQVLLGSNPSRYAAIEPVDATFPIINGIAKTSGLYINKADKGYTILFRSFDHGVQTESSSFSVEVGQPYTISVVSDISTAYGGKPFLPQPSAAIVDKGGNIVPSVSTGSFSLEILKNPVGGRLLPLQNLKAKIVNGIATFQHMYIDVAGSPYTLRYTTDCALPAQNFADTNPFTVAARVGTKLILVQTPREAIGGESFGLQPILKLVDDANNIVTDDSNSFVSVTISSNPSQGVLLPLTSHRAFIYKGYATFRLLRIDRAGRNYVLLFVLHKQLASGLYEAVDVSVYTPEFDVSVGKPVNLVLKRRLSDSVVDGQPNEVQPIVEIVDAGYNVVSSLMSGVVTASVMKSASVTSSVVVYTKLAPPLTISSVKAVPNSQFPMPYGEGVQFLIEVEFTDEVFAFGLPFLTLATDINDANMYGEAKCITLQQWTNVLNFKYTVAADDFTPILNYVSQSALTLPTGASIIDRNGNMPILTLPALDAATSLGGSSISIDTSPPVVIKVASSIPGDGVYGTNQAIHLDVYYSKAVTVVGKIWLVVALSTVGGQSTERIALFSSGNNTSILTFVYNVQSGDSTAINVPLDIVKDIQIDNTSTPKSAIYHYTSIHLSAADVTMSKTPQNLASTQSIYIDTSAPLVDPTVGVAAACGDGIYTPGDKIPITITFTKPVVVVGYPRLFVDAGTHRSAHAVYHAGSKSNVLTFVYKVSEFDTHSDRGNKFLTYLGDNALELNGGSITQKLESPPPGLLGVEAKLSLTEVSDSLKSLQDNSRIEIDGCRTTIVAITVANSPPNPASRGDVINISLSFSSRVHVDITKGTPTLALAVGSTPRFAQYTTGSGSLSLIFSYTVHLGDQAPAGLDYMSKYSLQLNGGKILKASANPIMEVSTILPAPSQLLTTNSLVVDPLTEVLTTAIKITADVPAGSYGEKHAIFLSVKFSDEVLTSGLPVLHLNTGRMAYYESGRGSSSLVFTYIVSPGDKTLSLDKFDDQSLVCEQPHCRITNRNNVNVVQSLTSLQLTPYNIVIDTHPPKVVRVFSRQMAPNINNNNFVVGDEITIIVEMDLEVFVDPPPTNFPSNAPKLWLETGVDGGRSASYRGYENDDRRYLLFIYIVQSGDNSDDLMYLNENALKLDAGNCQIKRFSTSPTTNAILTLPYPSSLGAFIGRKLAVNTRSIPSVISVSSSPVDIVYHGGDKVPIVVEFSQHVYVEGQPSLMLNLGPVYRSAIYVSGSSTTTLLFIYQVEDNDYTIDLEYADSHSLVAFDGSGAKIYHLSTNPTTEANLTLPFPYTENSLSSNTNIKINGRPPRIISASFVSPDGVYTTGQRLVMEFTFTSCVTVIPNSADGSVPRVRLHPTVLQSTNTTDMIVRYAHYVGGGSGQTLLFDYKIQTGDISNRLDYADSTSLELNGAKILTCTINMSENTPTQQADLHLGPPGGQLQGKIIQPIVFGECTFVDLHINRIGFFHSVFFIAQIGDSVLETFSQFSTYFSSAYLLQSNPSASNNELGTSVAVDGNTIVMGAPGTLQQISSVQIVTLLGQAKRYENEIQEIKTTATIQPAIQELTSAAAPGETVGGYFSLMLGNIGPTRKLLYNFDANQLKVAIELDLGFGLQSVSVSRSENVYCGCANAFQWTITFHNIAGYFPPLLALNYLTGHQSTVGDGRGDSFARIIVPSTVLSGYFTLRLGQLVTRNIAFNVGGDELSKILKQDLLLPVDRTTRSSPSSVMGYSWLITFTASENIYDIPELVPQSVGLGGYQAKIAIKTMREGQGRLSGSFRLRFRDDIFPNDETDDISVQANDQDLAIALKKLISIVDVHVSRSISMNEYGGYSWTITFLQVNTKNDYGPKLDTSGHLPALVPVVSTQVAGVDVQLLKGTGAYVNVQISGYANNPSTDSTMTTSGRPGTRAGMATVFTKIKSAWYQSGGSLSALDAQAGDEFGTSVDINQQNIIIGAPGAAIYGDAEQQNFLCDADGGYFTIIFRGKESSPVPYNADKLTFQTSIVEIMSTMYGAIEIPTTFMGDMLCSSTEISVVFKTSDHADIVGDIPTLLIDTSSLIKGNGKGSAIFREYNSGTLRRDGLKSKGFRSGAAYMFNSDSTRQVWRQVQKLAPPANSLSNYVQFGASVAIYHSFAVVGAPGSFENEGRAFVYQYNKGISQWQLFQILSSSPYDMVKSDRFGDCVDISGTVDTIITVVVGAPGYADGKGAVFVFDYADGYFQNRQRLVIQNADDSTSRFGSSIAIDMITTHTLVVGAPGYQDNSGLAVILARRTFRDSFFQVEQTLRGSDTSPRDMFGRSVAISKNTVLVGAHEVYLGRRTIRKPIQAITVSTNAAQFSTMKCNFRLKYRATDKFVITSSIDCDISAANLQRQLKSEMPDLGKIVVNREALATPKLGYTWFLTFVGSTHDIPLLKLVKIDNKNKDYFLFVIKWVVKVPPVLRSCVYVFQRTASLQWIQQASLFPRYKQYFAWFGVSVALDHRIGVIGAPNMDSYESGENSGGGFAYDLGMLALKFASKSVTVLEGDIATIQVERCDSNGVGYCAIDVSSAPELFINCDAGDAFANAIQNNYVHRPPYIGPYKHVAQLDAIKANSDVFFAPDVFGQEPYPLKPKGRWLFRRQVGTAVGRNQYYGSNDRHSRWIDGYYDFVGLSDFSTSADSLYFDQFTQGLSFQVFTTNDNVVEVPDETIVLRLSTPGIWPSMEGDLWSVLTIKDDGDGGYGSQASFDVLTPIEDSARDHESFFYGDFSAAIAKCRECHYAAVGAPRFGESESTAGCGAVYIYEEKSGIWELQTRLLPPTECVESMFFGMSLSLDNSLGTVKLIVGAPGIASAFIYTYQSKSTGWSLDGTLSEAVAYALSHKYAYSKAVALYGNIAVVGAAGLERVFVYHRKINGWELVKTLHSSDRIVHPNFEQYVEQTAFFGTAVAIHKRTIVVGAPQSDSGMFTPKEYHDRAFDKAYMGMGAAYIYRLPPQVHQINLRADKSLVRGTFVLSVSVWGVEETTYPLSYQVTDQELKRALEKLEHLNCIEASRLGTTEQGFIWYITFIGLTDSINMMTPKWFGYGCDDCVEFSTSYSLDPAKQIVASEKSGIGEWQVQTRLMAPDGNYGDSFGFSVAISEEQVIVGAPHSSALVTTTWNFETGDITGWQTTGEAFNNQPVFGDNSYARINPYEKKSFSKREPHGQHAGHEGRYWIGTHESRIGSAKIYASISVCAFASDYLCRASSDYKIPGDAVAGAYQGDIPQGTLTSQVFLIHNSNDTHPEERENKNQGKVRQAPWLSFLVGGGCDIDLIYVELLMNGKSVRKVTGQCDEHMHEVVWELHGYEYQAAQLRVVDNSSSAYWGHINFDNVRFSWDVTQSVTPNAGAAYTFGSTKIGTTGEPCIGINRIDECEWKFQTRLFASDKRSQDFFGFSVDVCDLNGIAVVGAPGQRGVNPDNTEFVNFEDIGSTYIFHRLVEIRDGERNLISPPTWQTRELTKFQPPWKHDSSYFGYDVDIDSDMLMVGAPGYTARHLGTNKGRAFIYDVRVAMVRFSQTEYFCVENTEHRTVSLTIVRPQIKSDEPLGKPLTIAYATEDLTSYGVDEKKFNSCWTTPMSKRLDCLDYQQTAGEITFAVGEFAKEIRIPIMDDYCYEPKVEHFIVRLNVPGGDPLLGEYQTARVRIDDDDFGRSQCTSTTTE